MTDILCPLAIEPVCCEQVPPVTHQQQVLAVVGFVHDVAGHQQGGAAAGQPVEPVPQLDPQDGVEPDGRFVENEQVGVGDQGAGQRDPGALSAGQVGGQSFSMVIHADRRDRFVRVMRVGAGQRGEVADVVDAPADPGRWSGPA